MHSQRLASLVTPTIQTYKSLYTLKMIKSSLINVIVIVMHLTFGVVFSSQLLLWVNLVTTNIPMNMNFLRLTLAYLY